jgi:hypothetical protein
MAREAKVSFSRIRRRRDHRLELELKSFINGVHVGSARTIADPPDHDEILNWFSAQEERLGSDIDEFLKTNGLLREREKVTHQPDLE